MENPKPLPLAVLLLAAACSDGPPPLKPVGLPLTAPIEIHGVPGPRSMDVVLTFERAASDVAVEVAGVDGLTVTTDRLPIRGASYRAGEKVTLHVEYVPGPGRSLLGISAAASYGPGISRHVASRVFDLGR